MIIATWNVERLKHKRQLGEIVAACADTHADILVLTETDTRVSLPYPYCFNSAPLCEDEGNYYSTTERRISIFTHYECVHRHQTFDEKTALCVELKTEKGNLLAYGTIIGAQKVYAEDENPVQPKNYIQIGEGDTLQFLCEYYGYDQTYQDTYKLGDPITLGKTVEISNTPIDRSKCRVTYCLTDLYQQPYWTPVAP